MKITTAYTPTMPEFDTLHATSLLLVGKNKPQFSSFSSSSTKRSTATDDCSELITSYTTTVLHRVIPEGPEGPEDEIDMNYNNTSTQQVVISSSINNELSHNDDDDDDDDETMMSLSKTTTATTTKRKQQQQQHQQQHQHQHQQDLSGPADESRWRIHGRERRIQILEDDKNKGGRSFSLSFDCSVQRYFSVAHWYVARSTNE
jgi:outer membrane usher protein FimD/PapC